MSLLPPNQVLTYKKGRGKDSSIKKGRTNLDKIKCETCGGTGGSRLVSKGDEIVTEFNKCEKCDGTGYVETMETVYRTGDVTDEEKENGIY